MLLSVAGNPAALDAVSAETTLAQLDVTGLEPGTYDVPVTAELPSGVTLVATPPTVSVTVTVAAAPSPATSPALTGPAHPRSPPLRYRWNPRRRERRPEADAGVRARPRDGHRLVGPDGALVVGQDTPAIRRHVRRRDHFPGATSLGTDVRHKVGLVPTPALAFLADEGDFAAGIMVSTSHNPADDNGLKVLDEQGLKLDDAIEDELERLIPWRAEGSVGSGTATSVERSPHAAPRSLPRPSAGPCARSGRWAARGPRLRERFRLRGGPRGARGATGAAEVDVIHADPDGVNINVDSGATDPAALARAVVERGVDVGFALDDADRLIAVDASGNVVDGDQVLGM